MVPGCSRPTIVRRISNPSNTTADGDILVDSNGTYWQLVPCFVTKGTNDRQAVIRDGKVYEQ